MVRAGLSQDESYLIDKHLGREGRILDGGCGGGRITLGLACKGYKHVAGFDFSEKMVSAAACHAQRMGYAFRLCTADATTLLYDENSFDGCIYGQHLLCFLPDEMARRNAIGEAFCGSGWCTGT